MKPHSTNIHPRFLLTNDDGIEAPGLKALSQAADSLGPLFTLAPVGAQSGCSHAVTTDRPVQIEQRGPDAYAVFGTPADCVRVGLHRFITEKCWILSGINHGGNLGADVYYSGTVAAVREGVLHGTPGIAFSHFRAKGREYDWDRAARWIQPVIQTLIEKPVEPGSFWNVNLPHLLPTDPDPEVVFCRLDPTPLPLSFRHGEDGFHYNGDYHNRTREAGCDVDVCFRGQIAVTQIRLF